MPPKRTVPAKPAASAPAAFTGFPRAALPFLADLAANNDRDWFLANKPVYEAAVHTPLIALVEAVSFALEIHDIPLRGDAKSLFRINRDIRFSNDKSPYKTNASAVLSRDGIKGSRGILYIQIGAVSDGGSYGGDSESGGGSGGSMIAAGFYGPDPADLTALRHAIAARPAAWHKMTAALGVANLAPSIEAALTRMPRGFEAHAASDIADALRLKNLVVTAPVAAARLHDADLVDDIAAFAAAALPLLEFGWNALERTPSRRT